MTTKSTFRPIQIPCRTVILTKSGRPCCEPGRKILPGSSSQFGGAPVSPPLGLRRLLGTCYVQLGMPLSVSAFVVLSSSYSV